MYAEEGNFTIYVNNIPPQLNEDGLRTLFSEYGKVLNILQPKSSSWAYISYPSYKEAELAMRHLDRKKPLELHIEVARKKDKDDKNESANVLKVPDFRIKHVNLPEARAPDLQLIKNAVQRTHLVPYRPNPDMDCLYPGEMTPDIFDPYETPDKYYDSNLMWTRGHYTITPDGRRQVYMGRGRTYYELPPYNPNTVQYVTQVYEMRNPQHYQYNHTQQNRGNANISENICLSCKHLATFQCSRCSGYYCSQACQAKDWTYHQHVCKEMPELVKKTENINLHNDEAKKVKDFPVLTNSNPVPIFKDETKLRKPHSSSLHLNSQRPQFDKTLYQDVQDAVELIKSNIELDKSMRKSPNKLNNMYPRKPTSGSPKNIQPNINNRSESPEVEEEEEKDPDDEPTAHGYSLPDLPPIKETVRKEVKRFKEDINFEFKKVASFSSNGTKVCISCVDTEKNIYWVQKVDELEKLDEMMCELHDKANAFPKVKAVVNQLYALKQDNLWHRAKIVSMDPLLVQFIDYGDVLEPQNKDFRAIGSFGDIPPFARPVKFLEIPQANEKLKLNDTVTAYYVSYDTNNCIEIVMSEKVREARKEFVQKAESNEPAKPVLGVDYLAQKTPPKNVTNDIDSIMKDVKAGDEGLLEVHTELKKNVFSITLVPDVIIKDFANVLRALPQICETSSQKIKDYKPIVGEYVVGKRNDGDWIRGKVLKLGSPITVAAIDEGRIAYVEKVTPLPEKYFTIAATAVTCEIITMNYPIKTGNQLRYIVTSTNIVEGNIPVAEIEIINEDQKFNKAIIKPWVPAPEQIGIKYSKIKNGSQVCITSFKNPYSVFIRSLDPNSVELYNRIIQDITTYSRTAKPLSRPPVKGEMVIAKYLEDNNFYRAIVSEIEGDKILIIYIDFGNIEETILKHLYEMPEKFKDGASIKHVILKDVPKNVSINDEVTEYLSMLVGEEKSLTCQIGESNNEVVLFNGKEIVNEKIQKLLIPSWEKKRPENDTFCYMASCLPPTKLGKVGDILEVNVLYTIEVGKEYFLCLTDYEMINHITVVMQEQIDKYVESNKEHYIPRENELCLALFEGVFYRSLCVLPNKTVTTAVVLFIDYGNIVEVNHSDIRLMSKDFVTTPALGLLCHVKNLLPASMDEKIPEAVEKRLKELIVDNEMVKIKIISYNEEDMSHDVELVDVKKDLVQKKLI